MIKLLSLSFLFLLFASFYDEDEGIYSVYFDLKNPPEMGKLDGFSEANFSTFNLVENESNVLRAAAGDQLIIDATGVFILKNKLLSISRTEIRENPKYTLREGYLHGIIPNDSVIVALEEDDYFFLIPKKTYLYSNSNPKTLLYQGLVKNEFLIFTKESNNYFSILRIQLNGKNITLAELDFDQKAFDFRTVRNKIDKNGSDLTYYLNPTKEEWVTLLKYYKIYDTYSRQV